MATARTAVFVLLALMAVSVYAQEVKPAHFYRTKGKTITFTRSRFLLSVTNESTVLPGTGLAAAYNITTDEGCTGKLYQTAIYAVVDPTNPDNTWANYDLSFYFDECNGSGWRKHDTGYPKGAIFATGLGTGITASSSYPKTVVGGFEGFSWVTSGYLQRISTTPVSTYTLTFK